MSSNVVIPVSNSIVESKSRNPLSYLVRLQTTRVRAFALGPNFFISVRFHEFQTDKSEKKTTVTNREREREKEIEREKETASKRSWRRQTPEKETAKSPWYRRGRGRRRGHTRRPWEILLGYRIVIAAGYSRARPTGRVGGADQRKRRRPDRRTRSAWMCRGTRGRVLSGDRRVECAEKVVNVGGGFRDVSGGFATRGVCSGSAWM